MNYMQVYQPYMKYRLHCERVPVIRVLLSRYAVEVTGFVAVNPTDFHLR